MYQCFTISVVFMFSLYMNNENNISPFEYADNLDFRKFYYLSKQCLYSISTSFCCYWNTLYKYFLLSFGKLYHICIVLPESLSPRSLSLSLALPPINFHQFSGRIYWVTFYVVNSIFAVFSLQPPVQFLILQMCVLYHCTAFSNCMFFLHLTSDLVS